MRVPAFNIGPMTKNVVDAVLAYNSKHRESAMGLIASRRQIDFDGGYVENWTSKDFATYAHQNGDCYILCRDHAGPMQGKVEDDGMESLTDDMKWYDVIHIDPWKAYPKYEDGLRETINIIKSFYKPECGPLWYEVGTEESIRKFTVAELHQFLTDLKAGLTEEEFERVTYVVVQSGTGLDLVEHRNTGEFDEQRLRDMIDVVKSFNKLSKEHNGDYLQPEGYFKRFELGLDSINIAPEFGQMETLIYTYLLNTEELTKWYDICLKSEKWKKWVNDPHDIPLMSLIGVCGHYTISDPEFVEMTKHVKEEADRLIKDMVTNKLRLLNNIWKRADQKR